MEPRFHNHGQKHHHEAKLRLDVHALIYGLVPRYLNINNPHSFQDKDIVHSYRTPYDKTDSMT